MPEERIPEEVEAEPQAPSGDEPEAQLPSGADAQVVAGTEGETRGDEAQGSGPVLRGAVVAPGLAIGVAHRKDYDLGSVDAARVALDEVDRELNRFRKSLDDSRLQLLDLKSRVRGRVEPDHARILDTHVAYLKDSVFIADVENLILNEQMRLEAAIAKVVGDFDRIFRLVQNDALRQSAVDLRDVGIRVLRNLERGDGEAQSAPVATDYVLIARELSIVDMFNMSNDHVLGIATQEGGLTSHAAIFARSMGIPTVTGVGGVLEVVGEGDFLILDATEGVLRVNPDDIVRSQYGPAQGESTESAPVEEQAPEWSMHAARTLDGEEIELAASCGSLPEVEQALRWGMGAIGLYRTELSFLVEKKRPSRDALVHHYASVLGSARDSAVTFRLLNADSTLDIEYLHGQREPNPSLGRVGIRALLASESVLRRQLQSILLAGAEAEIRIALPFVTDCGELRRVKEILFEERFELRKAGERFQDSVPVGVVVETPASLLGIRDLAQEADFLLLNLDSLQQYVLASDRDQDRALDEVASLHPFVLRALAKAARVASEAGKSLSVFGSSLVAADTLAHLIGVGLRDFCVPPSGLREILKSISGIDSRRAAKSAGSAMRSSCVAETQSLVSGYRHGYAGPS